MRNFLHFGSLIALLSVTGCSSPTVPESSGLAPSVLRPGLVWTHNDGPNLLSGKAGDRDLYLLTERGEVAATARLEADNGDWEDLARLTVNGKPYLLMAATGDNDESRQEYMLHLFPEPTPGQTLAAERTIRFRFPDGSHDCEAIAVDPLSRSIILIAKRARPAGVYRLPLEASGEEVLVAERVGEIGKLPLPTFWDKVRNFSQGRYTHQPTALDISEDGRRIAVLTYKAIYLWERAPEEAWIQVFAKTPSRLPLPAIGQYEGLTFMADGALVVSEEGSQDLLRLMP